MQAQNQLFSPLHCCSEQWHDRFYCSCLDGIQWAAVNNTTVIMTANSQLKTISQATNSQVMNQLNSATHAAGDLRIRVMSHCP